MFFFDFIEIFPGFKFFLWFYRDFSHFLRIL